MFHRSARLFLRPAFIEDAAAITAAIADFAIIRNLASAPWPYGIDDARAWIGLPATPRLPRLLITLPRDGQIIGGCGLHDHEGAAEIGYWIARPHWNRGYATEAGRGLLGMARVLGHRQLRARHAADNPGSGTVLRKLGFRPTGQTGLSFSRGRGAEFPSPEYAIDLEGEPGMPVPRAA
jgi:RimJ/RimL family protein N-acetyltransferase